MEVGTVMSHVCSANTALRHYRQRALLTDRPKPPPKAAATNRVFEAYQLSFDGPLYHSISQSTGYTGSPLPSPVSTEPLYHILEPTNSNRNTALHRTLESPASDCSPHDSCKSEAGTLV